MADTTTPQTDTHPVTPQKATDAHTMTREDFANLRALIAKVQDNTLQPVLVAIVNHLGHANGLDATEEDKRIADEAKKKADDDAKAAQEQADKDNAAADAKLAQAKRDMFVAMFGDSTSAPNATDTKPNEPVTDAKPAPVGTSTKSTTPNTSTPPKDAA